MLSNCRAGETPPWWSPRVDLEQLPNGDLQGRVHRFGEPGGARGAVFVFMSTQCPISNSFVPELNRLADHYGAKQFPFYGVISDPYTTREQAVRHQREYKVGFPVLFDSDQEIQKRLGPSHTPQAVVVTAEGLVCYSGRINNLFPAVGQRRDSANKHELRDALDAVLAGRRVSVWWSVPVGCPVESTTAAQPDTSITFNRDIAPILLKHCSECHRPRQAAPFPLLTYRDAIAHAHQIVHVTREKIMPPWHPADGYGHFRNARRLSESQVDLIERWVEAGMAEGDPADKPTAPQFASGWQLGEPDLVLRMSRAFTLPASGPDVYQHFVLPTSLTRGRMVTAVEFKPGNPRIVHHASFYLDTSGAARQLDARQPDVGYGSFSGPGFDNVGSLRSWLPGMSPRRLPASYGRELPARTDIVLEIHYRPSGKRESDRSTLAIHFADTPTRHMVAELQVQNRRLRIPAGENRHRHRATFTLPVAATLLDAAPHMHALGQEMRAVAVRPDGSTVPLIWIKNWDFNWQGQYLYREPIWLPAKTKIFVDALYDNSSDNPLNPHSPPREVRWGDGADDEMAICHFRYACDNAEDFRTMQIHHGRYANRQGDP